MKTWREQHWDYFGRTIAVSQLDRVLEKSKAILWCVVLETDDGWGNYILTDKVRIQGWSTTDDIKAAPEVELGKKRIKNRQIKLGDVKPLDQLVELLNE